LAASFEPVLLAVSLVNFTVTVLAALILFAILNPKITVVVEPATVYNVEKVPLSTATSAIVQTLNVFAILYLLS